MLLLASYFFYACWDWRFLGLILFSTVIDFFTAKKLNRTDTLEKRRRLLCVSIGVNVFLLGIFKYLNFFVENFIELFSLFGLHINSPVINIMLPVGISFYTFQTMGYTIDVYRKKIKPTTDFLDYALYVSFFPQLVTGPIERAKNLLPQISNPRTLSSHQLKEGSLLIYWGLFKKIVIADNIGVLLAYFGDPVSANGAAGDGGMVLATTYAYLIQLYCEFSAYSDIARGIAKLMGFEIMINFHAPFFAKNFQEFWNRWHISLTSWIRDYIYYPLAMVKIGKRYMSPMILVIFTFLIMGLWHGAGWNYVLWGGYNGLILVAYTIYARKTRTFRKSIPEFWKKLLTLLSILITFNFVAFGIILFRANSMDQIGHWIYHLFYNFGWSVEMQELLTKVIVYSIPLYIVDLFLHKNGDVLSVSKLPPVFKYGFLYILLFLMVVFHATARNFIYFQF